MTPDEALGEEWQPGPGGLPYRKAARVVVIGPDDRVLLVLGHDFGDVDHRWLFTVGGGIAPGETPREGACRELMEETGYEASPDDLVGPVLIRKRVFSFCQIDVRQDEEFFLWRAPDRAIPGPAQLTSLEEDVLDEFGWWTPADLARAEAEGTTVYPEGLPALAARWIAGWDGTCELLTDFPDED